MWNKLENGTKLSKIRIISNKNFSALKNPFKSFLFISFHPVGSHLQHTIAMEQCSNTDSFNLTSFPTVQKKLFQYFIALSYISKLPLLHVFYRNYFILFLCASSPLFVCSAFCTSRKAVKINFHVDFLLTEKLTDSLP